MADHAKPDPKLAEFIEKSGIPLGTEVLELFKGKYKWLQIWIFVCFTIV